MGHVSKRSVTKVRNGSGVLCFTLRFMGFRGGLVGKESACSARDLGSAPGLGRSPGGEHGNPFQYCCLQIHMERGAWPTAVRGVAKSQTRQSD